jgi:hypothetical protein
MRAHYWRAGRSYTALSGFSWSASVRGGWPSRRRLPGRFKSFFATGGARGTVSLDGATTRIEVIHGSELPVARLGLPGLSAPRTPVRTKNEPFAREGGRGRDRVLGRLVVIPAGHFLQVG